VSTVPLGRPSTPADVANACTFLASDEAEFITGVNLEVGVIENPIFIRSLLIISRSMAVAVSSDSC
jgi:hypothetical protein